MHTIRMYVLLFLVCVCVCACSFSPKPPIVLIGINVTTATTHPNRICEVSNNLPNKRNIDKI